MKELRTTPPLHKILLGAVLVLMLSCRALAPAPSETPTETASAVPSETPTQTPTSTETPTPTLTPSPTPSPTITPTPTPTSVFVSEPELIELSGSDHRDRPRLTGTVRKVDTQHFRIFYTLAGEDAVVIEDENGNAIPDYIEAVGEALEYSWQVEVEELGWAAPPPDGDLGGDGRYDVYIQDLDFTIAGMAQGGIPETTVGDNPNTDVVEQFASFSFVRVDNDFSEIGDYDFGISPLDFMRTTVAHELLHGLQFGYDGLEPQAWLWEASATWMETIVYDEIAESPLYLTASFKAPDTCLLSPGGFARVEDRLHWYSRWLFLHFLSERYGNEIIRNIWEQAVTHDGYSTLEAALSAHGTNLEAELRGYEVALLLRDFAFPLDYPTIRLQESLKSPDFYRPDDGIGQLGADFIEIDANGVVDVEVRQLTEGMLVGIDGGRADVYKLVDGQASIDAGAYEAAYLIVMNLDRAESITDCAYAPYSVKISPGEGQPAPDESLSSSAFLPPMVETLQPPEP